VGSNDGMVGKVFNHTGSSACVDVFYVTDRPKIGWSARPDGLKGGLGIYIGGNNTKTKPPNILK